MLIFENILLAISGLWANKMRALLTMLGIIIGISSVIGIMTVGDSMQSSVTSSMQSMGASNITVSLTQKSDSDVYDGGATLMFRRQSWSDEDLMTDAMIEDYLKYYGDQVEAIGLSEQVGSKEIVEGDQSVTVTLTGGNVEYQTVQNIEIQRGRFFTQEDVENERAVAIVSDVLCENLFPGQDPIGKTVSVTQGTKIYTFYIIGTYKYEDMGMVLGSTDAIPETAMYIPISVAKSMNHSAAGYSSFTVVGKAEVDAKALLEDTNNFFASYYTRNNSYTARATSLESVMEMMQEMMGTLSLAIAVIAGISLLVGGVGVMNIMLVSITERTREIGTRKALGATNGSIRVQFIVESVIICLFGGIIGIAVGAGLGSAGANLLGYAATPSVKAIVTAVTFSVAIGVFFGYYPANKAAKLDPIEALRYE